MNELSLFTGIAAGVLGTRLVGFHQVGYVEWDEDCQQRIARRIADGLLPVAPIFGDVRAFASHGYAAAYSGLVDLLSAGFPCQPNSYAGRMLGADDPRDMWPPTRDVVRIVRPRRILLENVTGLLAGYLGRVLADLAALGYVGRWGCISVGATGGDNERDRVWIVANADGERLQGPWPRRDAFHPAPHAYRQASGLVDAVQGAALPYVCREHPRDPDGMVRVKAVGNAQSPVVVANAWRVLA